MNLETRFFTFDELRAEMPEGDDQAAASGGGVRLVGYAAVFDSLSAELRAVRGAGSSAHVIRFRERIQPGAFAEALARAERPIRALFEHDRSKLLGTQRNETLQLHEDQRGLRVIIDVNMDTSHGRDAVAVVRRGDVDGMSFGFNVPDDGQVWRREDEMLVRELNNLNSA